MLLPAPPLYPRKRKPRPRRNQPTPPPVALTLVSAAFDDGPNVTLTFDRPIDFAALNGSAIVVDDGAVTGLMYEGGVNGFAAGPNGIVIPLFAAGDPTGTDVRLTASALTGIIAMDDGGAWAGVTNLLLPFP